MTQRETKLKVIEQTEQSPMTHQSMEPWMPQEGLSYAAILKNEMAGRLHQYQSGKAVLQAELDALQTRFEAEQSEVKQRHEHASAALLSRIDDIQKGEAMIAAALDKADEDNSQ